MTFDLYSRPDFLADDEEFLWSAAPDWENARRRKSWLERKVWPLAFLTLCLGVAGVAVANSNGALALLAAIFALFSLLAVLTNLPEANAVKLKAYILTNRRLIVESEDQRQSFGRGAISGVHVKSNGEVHDLTVYSGAEDAFSATLYAAPDAITLEKLITKHFLPELQS